MPDFIVKKRCEYSCLAREVGSKEEALHYSLHVPLYKWGQHWSEAEVEPYPNFRKIVESRLRDAINRKISLTDDELDDIVNEVDNAFFDVDIFTEEEYLRNPK